MDIRERFAAMARGDGRGSKVFVVERDTSGGMGAYEKLARFHYRSGAPATCAGVWAAYADDREAIGVLVVSMPVLNGSWREMAWPREYRSGDKRADARRLNDEVRCISRVIVHPRWRALGVAKTLVETYLRGALTCRTEAVAAMGAASPFFKAAGMTEHVLPAREWDVALARLLRERGVEPWQLGDVRRCAAMARHDGMLEGALRTWAKSSKSTSRWSRACTREVVRLAAQRVACETRAYTWEEKA